jgi:hypothetical protein
VHIAPGAGIKLISCDTATGGTPRRPAALARALGVEVIAPDQPVWTAMDGEEVVASPTVEGRDDRAGRSAGRALAPVRTRRNEFGQPRMG